MNIFEVIVQFLWKIVKSFNLVNSLVGGCSSRSLTTSKYKFPEVIARLEAFIYHHEEIKKCENDYQLFKVMGVSHRDGTRLSHKGKHYLRNGLCCVVFSQAVRDVWGSPNFANLSEEAKAKSIELTELKYKFFKSWKGYSGSTTYPVDGVEEYESIRNVADNPKRLDLAKHLLEEYKKVMV